MVFSISVTLSTKSFLYKDVLESLRKKVIRVRPDIVDKWLLHQDNVPCHTAFSVAECLTSKGIPVVPQPPYSPEISLCEFFLFPKVKDVLKRRHFGTLENIQKSVADMLKTIPAEDFQRCYQKWERLHRCVATQGKYFEIFFV